LPEKKVALRHVAPVIAQESHLYLDCQTFGDDLETEIVSQQDNRSANWLVLGIRNDAADKGSALS